MQSSQPAARLNMKPSTPQEKKRSKRHPKRLRWIGIFLCGLCVFTSSAQSNARIFDLLTKLKLATHDTARMDIYLQLADVHIENGNAPQKAINNATLALILAQNYDDQRRAFLALERLARIHATMKYDLKAAMEYLNEAKNIDTSFTTAADRAELYGDEGKIFMALNEYEKAQQAFLQQLTIYEKQGNKKGIAEANYQLGQLFNEQRDFKQALIYFDKALALYDELDDIRGRMYTLNALGKTHGLLGNYTRNLQLCTEALYLAQAANDRLQLAEIHVNIGYAYENLNNLTEALRYYTGALLIGEELGNLRITARAAREMGNMYSYLCNEDEALRYYHQALEAAQQAGSKALLKDIYQSLFEFHDENGRALEAYQWLKKLLTIKDELYDEERTRQLIHNQIRYQTEKKEEEVKLLRARELQNQIIIQNQRLQNYALTILILLVLAAIAILYSAFKRKKAYNELLEKEVQKRTAELRRYNEELAASNRQLEQSNTELERFAYIASHDLKSPLRNIISFLNLIERKVRRHPDTQLLEYLKFATDSARQMHQLILDVLEFSRVNQDEVQTSVVDLNDTLVSALRNLKEEMVQKKAVVEASKLPVVEANSVYMMQVLQNLIGNGIKYNESRIPIIQIGVTDKRTHYQFYVRDNGIGIPPEFHEQVFEMFKRLHTREQYQGTGIGLALCKKIILKLGGHIWLDSAAGQGTTFYFTIPKDRKAVTHTSPNHAQTHSAASIPHAAATSS